MHREGGKFRSFLLKSLDNLLANEWQRGQAQKRGSGQHLLSLDLYDAEARFALDAPGGESPESIFEKRWAYAVLDKVRERLRDEYRAAHKQEQFESLRHYLPGDRSGPAYLVAASALGMTENAVKVAVHRMRHRYGALLRQEIALTVSSAAEVDDEIRYLIGIVGT